MEAQIETISSSNLEKQEDFYDFIIVGAGSTGLTAAITAGKKNFKVIVLEKGNEVGPLPRGESMAYFPLEDEILGEGFIDSITTVNPSHRRYHSPWNKKETLVNVHTPYRFFPWRPFIEKFKQRALSENIELKLNATVISIIFDSEGRCCGVKYQDLEGKTHIIYGLITIGADGHNSIIGTRYNINYLTINCPIIKYLGKNANIDITKTPNPQFFLISPGQIPKFPQFPPVAAYYFPIGENNIEAGMMLRMNQVPKMKNTSLPSDEVIMDMWKYLKTEYPGFSEVFQGIDTDYEALTQMPNAKMLEHFIMGEGGALLIGDSAGFVDANGSSGLYYGMKMASEWIELFDPFLKEIKANSEDFLSQFHELWTREHLLLFLSLIHI